MEPLFEFIQNNIQHAHWVMFLMLLSAGFNVPVSEDAMIFISALLSLQYPELMHKFIIAVFAGAYLSDLIAFGLGRWLGPKLFKIRLFKNIATQERLDQVGSFYEKYGMITLFFGRFIPFGVRNALFISAGIGRMSPVRFCIADLAACVISFSVYFSLYYTFGEQVIDTVKQSNMVIFGVAIAVAVIWYARSKRKPQAN